MIFLLNILNRILDLYVLLIIVYAMMSWIPDAQNSQLHRFVASLVEPYLEIFRNRLFVVGFVDFSTMVGVIVIYMAKVGISTLM